MYTWHLAKRMLEYTWRYSIICRMTGEELILSNRDTASDKEKNSMVRNKHKGLLPHAVHSMN